MTRPAEAELVEGARLPAAAPVFGAGDEARWQPGFIARLDPA